MNGKIVKGISGFYYVYVVESGIYECRARGIFRKQNRKPLVGDDVEIEVLDELNKKGNLISIKKRRTELIRPAVANIDQALIIFAAADPEPNFNLLDRFLIRMFEQNIPVTICFNKVDLIDEEQKLTLKKIYENSSADVIFVSAKEEKGLEQIKNFLKNKTTTVAGPSGVGKSTIVNSIQGDVSMETGEISEKIKRGKHTTRHSELIFVEENTFIMDTPGFSSLELPEMEKEDLQGFYPEFVEYEPFCKFKGCSHIGETVCGVKRAVSDCKISQTRYDNYVLFYNEIKDKKKY